MKIRIVSLIATILAVPLAGCTAPAGGPWPREGVASPGSANPPAPVIAAENLVLTASTDRSRYTVGEPVYLTLRVRNATERPQPAVSSLDPSDGAVEVLITGPDGSERAFRPLVEADTDVDFHIELRPGEVIGGIASIHYGAGGWTFTRIGRYRIAAAYEVPKEGRFQRVVAQPIAVEIKASPVGTRLIGEDNEVRAEVGKFLTWQAGDHLERGQQRLRELLDEAPDSALAHYIHAAFARSLSEPFTDYRRGEVRPADCHRALDHLTRVDLGRMPDYIRMQSALAGARCHLQAKDWEAAAGYLDQAKKVKDDRPEFRNYAERLGRLEAYIDSARKTSQ